MAVDIETLTVEDLLAMPDDGRRVELVRGELIEMPPPGQLHGRLVANIVFAFKVHVQGAGLGSVFAESGVVITRNPATVLAPDVSVRVGSPIGSLEEPDGYVDGLPTIVVEVVSPSDIADAVHDKIQTYLDAGVTLVIAVWPRRRELTVATGGGRWLVLTNADTLDLASLVPGLTIPVASFFE